MTKESKHGKQCLTDFEDPDDPKWTGSPAPNDRGWICDVCGEFIPYVGERIEG